MTSPIPARSKTTPSSRELSAGRIVKKYQRLRKTGLLPEARVGGHGYSSLSVFCLFVCL